MPEDTMTLEPGTIAAESEAPSVTEETAALDAVETDELEPDVETGDGDSPLAGLSDEELRNDPKVQKLLKWEQDKAEQAKKDIRAQVEQETRAAAETQQYVAQRTAAQQFMAQGAYNSLAQLVKVIENGDHLDENGRPTKALDHLARLSAGMGDAVFLQQYDLMHDRALTELPKRYPDWKPSAEDISAIDRARRSRDFTGMFDALVGLAASAERAKAEREVRAAVLKEQGEKGKVAAKAAGAEQAADTRAAAERPTAVGGAAITPLNVTPKRLASMTQAEVNALMAMPGGEEAIDKASRKLAQGRT